MKSIYIKTYLIAVATVVASIAQADIVVQPTAATAVDNSGGAVGAINGSGFTAADAAIVETGDTVPATWPQNTGGDNANRWRGGWNSAGGGDNPTSSTGNYVWLDLGGTYGVTGAYWWSLARADDRGTFEASFAVSTDGGANYTPVLSDYVIMLPSDPNVNNGQYISFGHTYAGVTHVRVDNTRYSGYEGTIAEIRVTAIPEPATFGMVAAFGGGLLFIRRKLMM